MGTSVWHGQSEGRRRRMKWVHRGMPAATQIGVGLLVLALGWWGGNQRGATTDAEMRERLLRHAVEIADTVNPELARKLTFTSADKGTPAFERIRELMTVVGKTFPQR